MKLKSSTAETSSWKLRHVNMGEKLSSNLLSGTPQRKFCDSEDDDDAFCALFLMSAYRTRKTTEATVTNTILTSIIPLFSISLSTPEEHPLNHTIFLENFHDISTWLYLRTHSARFNCSHKNYLDICLTSLRPSDVYD